MMLRMTEALATTASTPATGTTEVHQLFIHVMAGWYSNGFQWEEVSRHREQEALRLALVRKASVGLRHAQITFYIRGTVWDSIINLGRW
mmetsp:Transcript_8450/g.22876  ORF Transcript_8450/g.22876 Transcript_8450/m.22876 type:complete len:89 (+) Transcript_8450:768-1034(+)